MSVAVNFAWDANPPGDNVTSYTLNRGTQTGVYTTAINVGNVLTGSDLIAASGTYYWALTAQNAIGISQPSAELSEFVLAVAPPSPTRMVVG